MQPSLRVRRSALYLVTISPVCVWGAGGVGGHAHAPARSTAGPSSPLSGSCCNLGADHALGDLPPSPFISSRRLYSVFRARLFAGQIKIKGRVHLLCPAFNMHSDNGVIKTHLALWIEWWLCRNPGSPHRMIATPAFIAPFPLRYTGDSMKNWFINDAI